MAKIDGSGVIKIKQEGFYYTVTENDALIFNKYLGYKLYKTNKLRTGFPVSGQNTVLNRINQLSMNYDLIDKSGTVILSKRFDENLYEILEENEYTPTEKAKPERKKQAKPALTETYATYIKILQGLAQGVNALSGELIPDLDDEFKGYCNDMAGYFDGKLKQKEKIERDYANIGKKWTDDEDANLLNEYNGGKSFKEIAEAHKRSVSAIRLRLITLGVTV